MQATSSQSSRSSSRNPAHIVLDRMFPEVPDDEVSTEDMASKVTLLQEKNRELWMRLRATRTPGQCSIADCIRPARLATQTGMCDECLTEASVDYVQMMSPIWHKRDRRDANYVDELVYYIRMGDRVKIGRSTNLQRRMKTFYAQPEQLLAVEPCVMHNGINRETQRHREFAAFRVGSTELFMLTEEIQDHIDEVVSIFGNPSVFI